MHIIVMGLQAFPKALLVQLFHYRVWKRFGSVGASRCLLGEKKIESPPAE